MKEVGKMEIKEEVRKEMVLYGRVSHSYPASHSQRSPGLAFDHQSLKPSNHQPSKQRDEQTNLPTPLHTAHLAPPDSHSIFIAQAHRPSPSRKP